MKKHIYLSVFVLLVHFTSLNIFKANNINKSYSKTQNTVNYFNVPYKQFIALPIINTSIDITQPNYNLLSACVFHETNEIRIKHKLSPFTNSPSLVKAATFHTKNMVYMNFYSHFDNKTPGCKTPHDRIQKFNSKYSFTGENICNFPLYNFNESDEYYIVKDNNIYRYYEILANDEKGEELKIYSYIEAAKEALANWMQSKGHKENILHNEFKEIGCGVFIKQFGENSEEMPKLYFTQNFGA